MTISVLIFYHFKFIIRYQSINNKMFIISNFENKFPSSTHIF